MLVLGRRLNERILIGDDIEVQVMSINGKQIKIGISAPKNISIHREELYNKIGSLTIDEARKNDC